MTIKAHKFKPGELVQYHENGVLYVGVVTKAWDAPRRGTPPQFTVLWAGHAPGSKQQSLVKQVSLRKYEE